ncbi:MAG: ribosome maturation factor RimM [Symploca sp. SIO2G7]|nr:ribosome maturation factor RimM [Symploca sp. SIO2G7]
MDNDDWLEIGKIVAPQGIKGECRVYPDTDFPERFEKPGKRWLQRPGEAQPQPVELLAGRFLQSKGLFIIKLAGVSDRNQAEALRGSKLLVPASDRPELGEDEYHVRDLVNLEVFNQFTGEVIGVVVEIIPAGNTLLEVQLHQQSQTAPTQPDSPTPTKVGKAKRKKSKPATVLIPFVKEIAPVVDLEKGRIEITPPAGLL